MRMMGLTTALVLLAACPALIHAQGFGFGGNDLHQSQNCQQQHACVGWQSCLNGEVNTGGIGHIDVRAGPQAVPAHLAHLACPDARASICCRIPDAIWVEQGSGALVGGGAGAWKGECSLHHACVPNLNCRNGVIDYTGIGLIDIRITPPKCTIKDPAYYDKPGVCCKFPEPYPELTCGTGSQCVPDNACAGIIATNVGGAYTNCYLDTFTGDIGVCCISSAPKPAPVASCGSAGSYFCANHSTCLGNLLPGPHGGHLSCYVGGTTYVGECCPTPLPVDSCASGNFNDKCVARGSCFGSTVVNEYFYEKTCYLKEGVTGVCCTGPEPLQTCQVGSCHTLDLCEGDLASIFSYPDCYVTNTIVGKCCIPKTIAPTIIDTCPGDSVCLPDLLCEKGEILDTSNVFQPSTNFGDWTSCKISGTGLVSPGVCCRNPTIVSALPEPAAQCGISRNYEQDRPDARIQNTEYLNYEAAFAEFPWQAIIFFTNFTFKCGATLISDEWILTAAHCVNGYSPNDLRVRLGEWKVDSYEEPGQYLDVNLHSIFIHPGFNSTNLHNDIALIQLASPIPFQYHINQVCVPQAGQEFYGQTRCYVTGWGKDAFDGGLYQVTMKKVDVPLVPKDQCQHRLRQSRLGGFFRLDKSFLCAGGEAGKDACEGDGGGPLVCQDPLTGNYVVAGITAWGIGCGEKLPGVYVDVQLFRNWMDGIVLGGQAVQQSQHSGFGYGRK